MLDPDGRAFYTGILSPPRQHHFDRAVAATYSLDLPTLLTVPLQILFADGGGNRDELLRDPIALLEAIRRTATKLRVYCQRGSISAPDRAQPLFALLEPIVREGVAPGGGVFHPKFWLLRFSSDTPEAPPILRLAILSRNITPDRSWDLSLVLEGRPAALPRPENEPLAGLLRHLDGPSTDDAGSDLGALVEELLRTEWELPEGFDRIQFHTLGLAPAPWLPARSDRLAVISPFCSDGALRRLAECTREPVALISRPEELLRLEAEARACFARALVLAERAESEDGEETDVAAGRLRGLHAKAYIAKRGWNTHLYMGSANATNASLIHGSNVEIMAELIGRASKVGSIDDLLGADGLMSVLEEMDWSDPPETDPAVLAAEAALERARTALGSAGLRLNCTSAGELWSLELSPDRPFDLAEVDSVRAWLITQPADRSADALPLAMGESVRLPCVTLTSITGFVAFEIRAARAPSALRFALNLPIDGLPLERNAAILRAVIQDRTGFLRYLMLLLSGLDEDTPFGPVGGGSSAAAGAWGTSGGFDDVPLLEDLTRALCRDTSRLRSIARVVEDIREGDEDIFPPGFIEMWEVLQSAVPEGLR